MVWWCTMSRGTGNYGNSLCRCLQRVFSRVYGFDTGSEMSSVTLELLHRISCQERVAAMHYVVFVHAVAVEDISLPLAAHHYTDSFDLIIRSRRSIPGQLVPEQNTCCASKRMLGWY